MKISMQVVLEELNVHASVMEYQITNESDFIDRIMFASTAQSVETGTLYIYGSAAKAPVFSQPDTAAIFFETVPADFSKAGSNYVVLNTETSPELIFNHLQTVFFRLNSWEQEAYETLISGKGLQALFNSALHILHNPVYLHDRDYKIIAYAEDRNNPVMGKSYEFLRTGKMSPEAILGLTKSPGFEKTFDASGANYWKKTSIYPDEYNYLYCNIRNGSEFVGRIFVDERVRPFRYADYSILEKLAQIVSQVFQVDNSFQSNHRNQLKCIITSLLDGQRVSAQRLTSELLELNWSTEQQYLCLVIRLKEGALKYNISDSICSLLEQQLKYCCAFLYEQNIIGIVGFDNQERTRPQIASQIESIFADYHLKAGISLSFRSLLDIAKHYKQAYAALSLGKKIHPNEMVYFFADYTFDYLIGQLAENLDSNALYPEGLRLLVQYDKENTTDYVATLRAYLENNCSPAQATRVLFIHRSTFLYRLEKIIQITNDDFGNSRVRLHYMVAYQLMDLEKNMGPDLQ